MYTAWLWSHWQGVIELLSNCVCPCNFSDPTVVNLKTGPFFLFW